MGAVDLHEKISILSGAAKYDASCATSGSSGFKGGKMGATLPSGVCHSWTQDGRCVSLLKVLYSNACKYDCAYCVNRASADIKRSSFTVKELAELTCEFYKRNYIEGLFLSSGIFSDPDIVMEKLTETAKTLRTEMGFGGYIHLKLIPGTGEKMIREAGKWADRLSVNIELPSEKSLNCLAPEKSKKDIIGAMNDFSNVRCETEEAKKKSRFLPQGKVSSPWFSPAGQSTQLIVGATGEDDRRIINLTSSLYNKFSLKRVYYSAFIHPGNLTHRTTNTNYADPRLPESISPPLVREHRLYQADWLLRFYHFSADEILTDDQPFLDVQLDPKTVWALNNLDFFPVEINRANYETLLRIPGIGAKTARRVIEMRRSRSLTIENLHKIGAAVKRARYFMTASGNYIERPDDPARIRRLLSDTDGAGLQLPLFEF
ncbi:MAG: putative DNA modification/repair radical SAM protein [Treponema sp.]|nr:putative DNA modification/repair radical SAM protein [Treponema sp.]MCL2272349.1 putative DNA modification/repair radical SAM protein [Treponema sp.]